MDKTFPVPWIIRMHSNDMIASYACADRGVGGGGYIRYEGNVQENGKEKYVMTATGSNSIDWIVEKITRLVQSLRAKSLLLPYPGDPAIPHTGPTAQSPEYSNLDAVDIAQGKDEDEDEL
ncbi:predicted protein [Histoplasma capsulatum G186AR]|uniref:Uncharacterized protein n=1 Tax=Ajellomyces capsulatus (strain G186AR / H82 / ATCC MYA-2454 / RMSCC 2432) TaxID=447093 RepID=C0NYD4_AJECG|nr:uncharacterized protein HCBG_07928 [Histoplasma capsulatum G186AR]EEH03802.1 predicted protein [Histoplasma capsulatum G186AR]